MNELSDKNWYAMSDAFIAETIGKFIRHHRLLKNLSQNEIAKQAGISRSTLSLMERGETVSVSTFLQVLRVLELFHVLDSFEVKKQMSPIALAKLEQSQKKRARGKKQKPSSNSNENDWSW